MEKARTNSFFKFEFLTKKLGKNGKNWIFVFQFNWKKKHEFYFFCRKVFLLSSLIFLFTKLSLIYQSQLQVELVQTLLWSISDTERYFWAKSFKFILAMYIVYIPLMNWTLTENCSYWRGENKYIFMSKFVTLTDFNDFNYISKFGNNRKL